MEEKINLILNNASIGLDDGFGGLNTVVSDDSFEDVAKEVADHFKEFMTWYLMGAHGFAKIESIDTLLFVSLEEGSAIKYDIDDLYKYWSLNIYRK